MSGWWNRFVFPWAMDCACRLPMIGEMRQKVIPHAHGRILEVGMGTGLNLAHYRPEQVESVTGLEPARELHPRALRRWQDHPLPLDVTTGRAESMPFGDATFDTVVLTYTLCSVDDPDLALREMRRVLKPDGELLFCEHGLAPDAGVARWQHAMQPLWGKLAAGCHLDRATASLIGTNGFVMPDLQEGYLPGPRPWTFHSWGRARKTG